MYLTVQTSKPRSPSRIGTFLRFRAAYRYPGNSLLALGKRDREGDEVNHAPRKRRCREENGKCGRRFLDGPEKRREGKKKRIAQVGREKEKDTRNDNFVKETSCASAS